MNATQGCPRFIVLINALLFGAFVTPAISQPSADIVLGQAADKLTLNVEGALMGWKGRFERPSEAEQFQAGLLRYGNRTLKLQAPETARAGDRVTFKYRWPGEPGLEVSIVHQLKKEHGATLWTRDFELRCTTRLQADLTVTLQSWPEGLSRDTWLPLLNGTGALLGTNAAAAFHFAGALPGEGALLALPMVSIPGKIKGARIMLAADPYFSTLFKPATVEWTYPARAGLENGCEKRKLVVAVLPASGGGDQPHLKAMHGADDPVHQAVEASLACFFRTMLPKVAPGPDWLHEIALVDFDYLSDGGQGWFNDLNALNAAIPKKDRRQVFLCLHGWYDFLGRYCFDASTGKLDREWTAFSSYELARTKPRFGMIGGEQVEMGFGNCKPLKMSVAEVHRRLQYARSRGFRAGLYFADGMNAGAGLPGFEPDRVLQWGGWQGPDSKGKSYLQNPLHPKVQSFFLEYTKALLAEFGPDMDALVWDETFHIPCGKLGTEACPGYADRAMLRLTQEITALVDDYNRGHHRQIAFLTSDCLGAFGNELKGPYALVSHGTYQDSWCQPKAWSYGVYANYRNVLWSCAWWYETKWNWVEFGVRQYQAPVSITNGWGDDKGFAELTPAQRARVLELFRWRKQHPTRLRWLERLPSEPDSPAKHVL